MTEDEAEISGRYCAVSSEEALDGAVKRQGDQASILVLTHGGETLPIVGGGY